MTQLYYISNLLHRTVNNRRKCGLMKAVLILTGWEKPIYCYKTNIQSNEYDPFAWLSFHRNYVDVITSLFPVNSQWGSRLNELDRNELVWVTAASIFFLPPTTARVILPKVALAYVLIYDYRDKHDMCSTCWYIRLFHCYKNILNVAKQEYTSMNIAISDVEWK